MLFNPTLAAIGLPLNPIVAFTVLLLVIWLVPPWFERLRLPGLVGLLLAGVILGPSGAQLLDPNSETIDLLSDIGKLYLMFVAGLEIDLVQFRQKKLRSLGFGAATFLIPLMVGTAIGRFFGFAWNPAILIGSLFASHTLLGYPIVRRLGLTSNEAVIVSIGATIFTDIAALLVLAICVAVNAGDFSWFGLSWQLGSLAIYAALVLFGLDWFGKIYFQKTGDEEGNQFLFVFLSIFLVSVGAQVIHIEKIVGAFLAGLAINDVVGRSPVKEKVEFVGSVLFVPFFFVGMGLLLDLPLFLETLTRSFSLTAAIVLGLIGSKFLAAWIAKRSYGYSWNEAMVMWSLSMPQVAATLAAAWVGVETGLLTETVFNAVIVLMLVTSILGPMLTAQFAPKLPQIQPMLIKERVSLWWENRHESAIEENEFSVVVPVSNPHTERLLLEMAALLAQYEDGSIVPTAIVPFSGSMDEPELQVALHNGKQLLKQAAQWGQELTVKIEPLLRIDSDVATGILRTARERDASAIVMGWSEEIGLRSRLFGNLIDSVLQASHCPVLVVRFIETPLQVRRILVPVKVLTPQAIRTVRFAQLLAQIHGATVTLLHVCPGQTPPERVDILREAFTLILQEGNADFKIEIVSSDNRVDRILEASRTNDLMVWRSQRRYTVAGLTASDVTTQVMENLACSMLLFGEPQVFGEMG
ncbi:MAG: cation:proton antiporter [Cyanobacteriota bacterium]|nr:cation:proton antiporter [Cyanobacteriota bacterium]